MERNWFWEESGSGGDYGLRLGCTDPESERTVYLTPFCGSKEGLRREIENLTAEIGQMLGRAEEMLETRREDEETPPPEPEEIWKYMAELPTEQEMFGYFNSLEEETRRRTAEYVLTRVSMFRGRGASFALHYDAVTHYLA